MDSAGKVSSPAKELSKVEESNQTAGTEVEGGAIVNAPGHPGALEVVAATTRSSGTHVTVEGEAHDGASSYPRAEDTVAAVFECPSVQERKMPLFLFLGKSYSYNNTLLTHLKLSSPPPGTSLMRYFPGLEILVIRSDQRYFGCVWSSSLSSSVPGSSSVVCISSVLLMADSRRRSLSSTSPLTVGLLK